MIIMLRISCLWLYFLWEFEYKIYNNGVFMFVYHLCLFGVELEVAWFDSYLAIGHSWVVLYGVYCHIDVLYKVTI